MVKYANGRIPAGVLFTVASGTDSNGYWEFQFSAGTWAKWQAAKRYAENKWNRTLYIRTGWNVYRPLNIQQQARDRACAQGNCLGAAWPGTSSHGGTWSSNRHTGGKLVDALAIDVDPNGLTWAQVWEACRAAGFLCGAITKDVAGIDEPWHIIDLDPWRAVPASGGSTPFEEDDMKQDERDWLYALYQRLLPGETGKKAAGDVYTQVTIPTLNAAKAAQAAAEAAKAAIEAHGKEWQQGIAGVREAGRLYLILTQAANSKPAAVEVDVAALAQQIAAALPAPSAGVTKAEVQEALTAALKTLTLKAQ